MPRIVSEIVDVYVFRVVDGIPAFLVLRRAPTSRLPGTWQAVHGHIESGETAFQAAARELAEETTLVADEWHQLESVNTFFVAASDEIHLCAGFAARIPATAAVSLNSEHVDYVWLGFSEACERYHWPGQRRAIKEIRDLILPGGDVARTLRLSAR